MYKLIVTELAHQDLDKIVSYIAVELVNPICHKFSDEVDKCYGFLKSNPWMYGKCQDKHLDTKDIDEHPSRIIYVSKLMKSSKQ